jgi:hypothetical protein
VLSRFAVGDECWLWQGQRSRVGYGIYGRKAQRAHRLVYELLHSEIPADHDLHHVCGVKACVRPGHLQPMTRADHMRYHGQAVRDASQRTAQRLLGHAR